MITTYNQKKVYYEVHGEGEPIILLNGIMMSTKSWQPLLKGLHEYQVILIDLFDQGQTDNLESYSISDQGNLVIHIMNELNLKQIHLVGISYGGEVALDVSIKTQTSIQTLHIFHSACYTDEHLFQLGTKWLHLTKTLQGQKFYEETIPNIYGSTFKQEHYEWMQSREILLKPIFQDEQFLNRMHRLTQSSQHFDCRDQLSNISLPTIIVSGSEDTLIPLRYQNEINQYIKHASHIIVEHVGHAMMYEKPEIFLTIILGFIQSNRAKLSI